MKVAQSIQRLLSNIKREQWFARRSTMNVTRVDSSTLPNSISMRCDESENVLGHRFSFLVHYGLRFQAYMFTLLLF